MEKSYIENKKQKLQNELLTIKEKALEILSKFETTNGNYDIMKDIERLKKDIENEDWYIITTSVGFLRVGLVYLEKNEELKERNLVLWKELDNLCSNLHKTFSELNSCDSIMDNGPLCVENKTIVITDPCYLMIDRDETNRPKWDDYFSHKSMREYPDYNKEKDTSKQFKKDYEKYDKAYKKWDEENPEDWERCNYGDNMEVLGINNYLCASTIYGDWSCTTFDKDTNKPIGQFCADAGLVCVCLLDEVLKYNPNFLNWAKEHEWCATIIENFTGEVWIKVDEDIEATQEESSEDEICYDEDYVVYVEGIGNINFKTAQTGF